jgi:hypothetical protein
VALGTRASRRICGTRSPTLFRIVGSTPRAIFSEKRDCQGSSRRGQQTLRQLQRPSRRLHEKVLCRALRP